MLNGTKKGTTEKVAATVFASLGLKAKRNALLLVSHVSN